jgi:hypothetical protein
VDRGYCHRYDCCFLQRHALRVNRSELTLSDKIRLCRSLSILALTPDGRQVTLVDALKLPPSILLGF